MLNLRTHGGTLIDLPTKADVYCSDGVTEGGSILSCDAIVKATDGYVGQVDELLIHSNGMEATHLVLIVRHIFNAGKIIIPVSQIDHIEAGTIYLKLDRQGVKGFSKAPGAGFLVFSP